MELFTGRARSLRVAFGPRTAEATMDSLLRSLLKCVQRRLRLDEDLTVGAVTHELGFSRQYISGRFHRATGRMLSQFLKEKRLDKAAKMLRRGHMKVGQIARRCGFDSENYFRRQFKSRFGMSPLEFRGNHGRTPEPDESSAIG